MSEFFIVVLHNPFLQIALLAALLASIAGGIVGSYVVAKRIVFISGSISHAVLGGIGLFVLLGYKTGSPLFSPLLGALVSALLFGLLIGQTHLRYKQREDTVIASIWSLGMALGVITISLVPSSNLALMDFLFGNLLWTTMTDIYWLLTLDIVIILTCLVCHRRFLAISFDETQCLLQKQPVTLLYFILLMLISTTVVLMIQTIGAILVIAMLCLPAAIANLFTTRLSKMIYLAIAFSLLFSLIGIFLSYSFNWPPGATIALVITLFYFLSLPVKAHSV